MTQNRREIDRNLHILSIKELILMHTYLSEDANLSSAPNLLPNLCLFLAIALNLRQECFRYWPHQPIILIYFITLKGLCTLAACHNNYHSGLGYCRLMQKMEIFPAHNCLLQIAANSQHSVNQP